MLNVPDNQLHELKQILQAHLPNTAKIYAFGSRTNNTARTNSDLDLLIKNPNQIPWNILAETEEALSESELPFRVDLLDSHRLTDEFLNEITSSAVLLPLT